jgi:small subunit ribosomal protein S21
MINQSKKTVIQKLMSKGFPSKPKIPGPVPSHIKPLEVVVEGNDDYSFHEAHKRFRKMVQKERIIGQFKERQYYEKPSEKKRRKRREAFERRMANERQEKLIASGEYDKRKNQDSDDDY